MSLKSRIERLETRRVPSHSDFTDFSNDEIDVGVLILARCSIAQDVLGEQERASALAKIAAIEARHSPEKIEEISARIVPVLEEYAWKLHQQQ